MAGKYTPNELEQLVVHELRRAGELPEGLRVQILRTSLGWRPIIQAMPPDSAADVRTSLAERIDRVGGELAQVHDLIGS